MNNELERITKIFEEALATKVPKKEAQMIITHCFNGRFYRLNTFNGYEIYDNAEWRQLTPEEYEAIKESGFYKMHKAAFDDFFAEYKKDSK